MPRIEVDLTGETPRATTRHSDALKPGELTALVAVDQRTQFNPAHPAGDRFMPISPGRWALGRGSDTGVVWRVTDTEAFSLMFHPAWLWTKDRWFDGTAEQKLGMAEIPVPLALRSLTRLSLPLCGTRRTTNESIADVIQGLRKARKPVAILVPADCTETDHNLVRWFSLAVLSCLPPSRRESIRISTYEQTPDPKKWDMVFVTEVPAEGFLTIDIRRPSPKSTDLVVYYILNRLHANDPEAVEVSAFLTEGDGPDPWGDGISSHLKAGIPGISSVDAQMVERDPKGSVEAVLARIRSGVKITESVADQIAMVTTATGDARPWRALVSRAAEERVTALRAWLPLATRTRPSHSLLRTVSALYPRTESLEPWFRALLQWFDDGYALELIRELISSALLETDQQRNLATNATIWCELILTLSRKGRPEEALEALLSPVGDSLARAGVARSLVLCWMSIPSHHRTQETLKDLIDLFVDAPDGDVACSILLRNMIREGRERPMQLLLQQWASQHPGGELREEDELYRTLIDCGHNDAWVYAVAATAETEHVRAAVEAFVDGPEDPAWLIAERAHAESLLEQPRERFVSLAHFLPEAMPALEPVALTIASDALIEAGFPDPEMCDIASDFTELEDASPLWMWLAITAAPPGRFDDDTLDATVTAFSSEPPPEEELRVAAGRAADALGVAAAWSPSDLASWLVRLCLAPDGDDSGFNYELARRIVHAIPQRADGTECLASITNSLTSLPVDHPVMWIFLEYLLPDAWPGDVPEGYLSQVKVHVMSDEVHAAWAKALG
jgi:hypothetical protein